MTALSDRLLVLLVEDSEDDVFFFNHALRQAGVACDVVHVADGAAAIRFFEEVLAGTRPAPQLVFLDQKIPIVGGLEVLAWVRKHFTGPAPEILILSGSDQASDVSRACALGAAGYYVKPILAPQLKSRLAACLERQPAMPIAREGAIHGSLA